MYLLGNCSGHAREREKARVQAFENIAIWTTEIYSVAYRGPWSRHESLTGNPPLLNVNCRQTPALTIKLNDDLEN